MEGVTTKVSEDRGNAVLLSARGLSKSFGALRVVTDLDFDVADREVVGVLAGGALRPVVDRVYPFPEVRTAFERLARAEQLGKVVVEVGAGVGDSIATGIQETQWQSNQESGT